MADLITRQTPPRRTGVWGASAPRCRHPGSIGATGGRAAGPTEFIVLIHGYMNGLNGIHGSVTLNRLMAAIYADDISWLRAKENIDCAFGFSFKNLYPNYSHFGLELWSHAFHGLPCVANQAVSPSAAPCRKSGRLRFALITIVVLAAIGGGVATMEGDSRIALLIGVAPLVLVALVCVCSPCVKDSDSHHH